MKVQYHIKGYVHFSLIIKLLMEKHLVTLITGAAGNLGGLLAQHMIKQNYPLHLLIHKNEIPFKVESESDVKVFKGDLAFPHTLIEPCKGVDAIVHFAGVLFKSSPEKFLPITNTEYFINLVNVAIESGVKKIILISFPHVEGETTPEQPAQGILTGNPDSVHGKTRLLEEKYLFEKNKKFPDSSDFTSCRHDIWKRNTNDRCCEMAGKKMASWNLEKGNLDSPYIIARFFKGR